MDIADVDALARLAHEGQTDRTGVPYVEHVRAVAAGLAAFGPELRMAGLLHDVVEDTHWTAARLRAAGVPDRVVAVVEQVTNRPGVPYEDTLLRIAGCRDADLVKIADNAQQPPGPGGATRRGAAAATGRQVPPRPGDPVARGAAPGRRHDPHGRQPGTAAGSSAGRRIALTTRCRLASQIAASTA